MARLPTFSSLALAAAAALTLSVADGACAQDSLQNGSTAVVQSGAAASAVVGGTLAVGSAVVGTGVSAVGGSAMAVGGSTLMVGGELARGADAAARFASGPLPVDRAVVVTAQDAPRVPYDAQPPSGAAPAQDAAAVR